MTQTTTNVSAEALSLIGRESEWVEAPEPVDRGAIRRFAQAIMDDNPIYDDLDAARARGFDAIVAPPLFPLHAMRRAGGTSDPLDAAYADPDYDGAGDVTARFGLPRVPIPFKRLLNGGNEIEVFSLAEVGDRLACRSKYIEITEKAGRSGPFVIVRIDTVYKAMDDERRLLHSIQTHIWR
jgi:hypothetical protein